MVDTEAVGCQSFVKIACNENSEDIELPCEKDGTLLLSTLQAQFPTAIGLKYRSSSGGWRGIRVSENAFDPPFGGWKETVYYITESDALKRKSEDVDEKKHKKHLKEDLLQDIIVLGLPFTADEETLKEYFTSKCGELAFYEVKYDRTTKKSRGFGFIRFKSEEAAKAALNGNHEINGRRLEIRLSKQNNEKPLKLFIGRLPPGVTEEDLNNYFSDFGELTDMFLPKPFRGFAFVTYTSESDGHRVLRKPHILQGVRLNVTVAEPKEEKPQRVQQHSFSSNNGSNNYTWNPDNSRNNSYSHAGKYDPNASYHDQAEKSDMASDLKNMLYAFLSNQK